MIPRAPAVPVGIGLGLVAPLVLSFGATPASGGGGAASAAPQAMVAAVPDRVEQARGRVRARPEWRSLRRRVSEAPPAPRSRRGCEGKRVAPRKRPSSGCGGMSQAFSGLSTVLAVALVGVLLFGILWAIISARSDKTEEEDSNGQDADAGVLSPETPPGERPVSTYLRRAQAYAQEGDFRRALRELLLGSMSWTERQGLIRFRRGLTNRDYLRALARRGSQHQSMGAVAMEFDKVYFGRRSPTRDRYERVLPSYRTAFEGGDEEPEGSPDGAAHA